MHQLFPPTSRAIGSNVSRDLNLGIILAIILPSYMHQLSSHTSDTIMYTWIWITRSRVKFLPFHYEFKSTVVRICIAALWWPTVFEKQVKIGCHTLSFDHNLEVQSLTQCNRIGHAIVMSGITVNFESKGETSLAYERAKTITSRLSLCLKYGFFSAITEIAAYMKR